MYIFYSSPENKIRVTVVGDFDNGALKLAVSRNSKRDQFIRKKGRMIATGRFNKGYYYKIVMVPEQSSDVFIEEAKKVVLDVIDNPERVPFSEEVLEATSGGMVDEIKFFLRKLY